MRRPILLVTVAVFLLAAPAVSADPKPEIAGKYDCKGKDADGGDYKGTVEIKKDKDTYVVTWDLGNFGRFVGVGIRTDKILSVSWLSGVNAGVMVYQIKDRKLEGRWAQLGAKGTIQKETLTLQKKE
jgi:hypothetical protein